MRRTLLSVVLASAVAVALLHAQAGRALTVHFIDVEGGQATLFVAPSGESLLVDTGWPGFEGRDAARIAEAAAKAGVKQIDYLVTTHFHRDHVGGVPQLSARLPIRTFVDHGDSVETSDAAAGLFRAYDEERRKGKHILVRPGDRIPVKGLDVQVVAAAGRRMPGGSANEFCASSSPKDPDAGENAQSVGILVTLGRFRLVDLGDLTWNKEHDLVCPDNPIGRVDVYVTTHHGTDTSGSPVIVNALAPRVAIMNNGATKGGAPAAWAVIAKSPRLEDLWQLHHSVAGGTTHNAPDALIANVGESDTGHGIALTATPDGRFTVRNLRNGHERTY